MPQKASQKPRKTLSQDDSFLARQQRRREALIEKSWDIIETGQRLMEARLRRGAEREAEIDTLIAALIEDPTLRREETRDAVRRLAALKDEDLSKVSAAIGAAYEMQATVEKEAYGTAESEEMTPFEDF